MVSASTSREPSSWPLIATTASKSTSDRPKKLLAISLMGQQLPMIDISDQTQESESSAFSAKFNSNHISPTKKGSRDNIPLTLLMEGDYELSTNLQGKWYKPTSTQHCDWGTIVHNIEY